MPDSPVARSAIRPTPPTAIRDGWEISAVRARGALRLADWSPLVKVVVRASPQGELAAALGVPLGRAATSSSGTLVVGSGPGEWLLLAGPHGTDDVRRNLGVIDEWASVVDVTHGRTLMRLTGANGHEVLAKLCAIDFSDDTTPDGTAFRSAVAKVATDVVRDDQRSAGQVERSYLLHCERSVGQYLFNAILDAGREFDLQVDGFRGVPD